MTTGRKERVVRTVLYVPDGMVAELLCLRCGGKTVRASHPRTEPFCAKCDRPVHDADAQALAEAARIIEHHTRLVHILERHGGEFIDCVYAECADAREWLTSNPGGR